MARKIEDWFRITEQFAKQEDLKALSTRELVVVIASLLDIAVGHLIEMRLLDNKKEVEEFLGFNDNGRAPVASFGARIQLALLLGLITESEANALRAFKAIRNHFAHKVDVKLTDDTCTPLIRRIALFFTEYFPPTTKKGKREDIYKSYMDLVSSHESLAITSLSATFSLMNRRLVGMSAKMQRITPP